MHRFSNEEQKRQVTEAYLYLDVETDFRWANPMELCLERVNMAEQEAWETLTRDHIADFTGLFQRLQLRFASTDAARDLIPTDVRLKEVQKGATDMGLVELYFQYGRYLLISSSREGTLPANLQGIWNDQLQPAWDSKFTININTEMNYWIAGSGNLPECHLPLFDLLE